MAAPFRGQRLLSIVACQAERPTASTQLWSRSSTGNTLWRARSRLPLAHTAHRAALLWPPAVQCRASVLLRPGESDHRAQNSEGPEPRQPHRHHAHRAGTARALRLRRRRSRRRERPLHRPRGPAKAHEQTRHCASDPEPADEPTGGPRRRRLEQPRTTARSKTRSLGGPRGATSRST